jgi:hypothetical protein
MNAYMLTGDDRYLQPWRDQIAAVNQNVKMIDGKPHYPRMYGDQGWYDFRPSPYQVGVRQIAYLSMKPEDRAAVAGDAWYRYLDGKNPGYPEAVLRGDLARVRERVRGLRHDKTTPDTRLADDPMKYNPASITSLLQLMMGGMHPGHCGSVLHARLRYFDPVRRRAGIPDGVSALVEKLSDKSVTILLVNTNQLTSRELIVQAGSYGEHTFQDVTSGETTTDINGPNLLVRLQPGCGSRLTFSMSRFSRPPTLAFPWAQ